MAKPITLRIPEDDLAEIDRLADTAGQNRSEFMIAAALGRTTILDEILDRLDRVERATFGGNA